MQQKLGSQARRHALKLPRLRVSYLEHSSAKLSGAHARPVDPLSGQLPRLYRYTGITTPPISCVLPVGTGDWTRFGDEIGLGVGLDVPLLGLVVGCREGGLVGCDGVVDGRDVVVDGRDVSMTADGVADGILVGIWGKRWI